LTNYHTPPNVSTLLCHPQGARSLARYWLRASWGWHDNVETCRRSMIICELFVN